MPRVLNDLDAHLENIILSKNPQCLQGKGTTHKHKASQREHHGLEIVCIIEETMNSRIHQVFFQDNT